MTVELGVLRKGSWQTFWPAFAVGLCGPLLGLVLAGWLPFHLAMGFGFLVVGFFVGLIIARRSPPKWRIPGWLVVLLTSAAGGLTVGVLSYYFPWR